MHIDSLEGPCQTTTCFKRGRHICTAVNGKNGQLLQLMVNHKISKNCSAVPSLLLACAATDAIRWQRTLLPFIWPNKRQQ